MGNAKRRRCLSIGAGAIALCLLATPIPASASGPPLSGAAWSFAVLPDSARLGAQINPNGLPTAYHFDYLTKAAYEANLAAGREGFTAAAKAPAVTDVNIGAGSGYVAVSQLLAGLSAATAYRYRIVAHNSAGSAPGPAHDFETQPPPGPTLADSRGWELVSPIDKNGGEIGAGGEGALQAAAGGGQLAYSSSASFAGGEGAPPISTYLATRSSGGWATANLSAPLFAGGYHSPQGASPYRIFSADLARAVLAGGDRCRSEGEACPAPNPPLPGTDAPAGYEDYYLAEGGSFTALLGAANAGFLSLEPSRFELGLAGASPDLRHVVLESCAALSAEATEAALGEGCDPNAQNLYEYSPGQGLSLLNLLPAETQGTPGAALAAPQGAVSEDGSRVYFTDRGSLYLREGQATKLLAPQGEFQTASANGATALYTKPDGHLYRYEAAGVGASTDLTPAGGVKGVLGASSSADTVYYQDASGIERWHAGASTSVAAGTEAATPSDWPPATATVRVSADGTKLLFLSKEALSGYDNTDLNTALPDAEAFLYDAAAPDPLTCVSCNPTNERPIGSSTIPGGLGSPPYKPRVLSTDAQRVFFDSADALASADVNADHTTGVGIADAYEWEAQGEGSCGRAGGCLSLISSGRDPGGASFADASADGGDAFFATAASLVSSDPGSEDLYDARIGGGLPQPSPPLACEGDACQPLVSEPTDPTLDTLLTGPGNPPVRYPGVRCRAGFAKRQGECVRRKPKKHKGHRKKHGAKKKHHRGGAR